MRLKLHWSSYLVKLLFNIALVDYVLIAYCSSRINANMIPGIPIGKMIQHFFSNFFSNAYKNIDTQAILYDLNTTSEIKNLVNSALISINEGIEFGRNMWSLKAQTINVSKIIYTHEVI